MMRMMFRGTFATLFATKKFLVAVLVAVVVAMAAVAPFVPSGALSKAYAEEARLSHVTDVVGLLTEEEMYALEAQGRAIEDAYGFGAYVIVIDDYQRFDSSSIYEAAKSIYLEYALGVGEGKDGVLLFLSMSGRDYSFIAYGATGTSVFNDSARATVADYFLDDLSRNAWYDGFADFFTQVDLCLEAHEQGVPYTGSGSSDVPYGGAYYEDYDEDDYYYENYREPGGSAYVDAEDLLKTLGMFAIGVLVIPFIIMLIVIAVLDGKMRSVAPATHASEYVVGNLELSRRSDRFTHTTESVVVVEDDDDRPGFGDGFSGGGGSFGGGFRGGGGKF